VTTHEKRSEARREASGQVRVTFTDPEPLEIDGRLMDVSASGFRMAHFAAFWATGGVRAS